MKPSFFGRIHGRRLAAFVLTIGVVGGGVYGIGSRLAQVSSPNMCIRSFGPFFPLQSEAIVKDSISAWPGTNRFVKVTGPSTVSLFQYDQGGVIQKISDLPGVYKAAAVTVIDDNRIAIAYYDETAEGLKAYFRIFTTGGNGLTFDEGTPVFIADIPSDFEPHVRFAIDTINRSQFALVTNIPPIGGQPSLRALVSGVNGTTGTLVPIGIPSAQPPSDTPEAIMDFDVAGIDQPGINTTTFIVAFRGTAGLQYLRGAQYSTSVVFDSAYLKTVSATAKNVDLASSYGKKIVTSYAEQLKTAMTYVENGRVYAGQITLASDETIMVNGVPTSSFDDAFTSTSVGRARDVMLSNGVAWLDHENFVVAYGVQQTQDGSRGGVYFRRATAGTMLFGSEMRVTPTEAPRSIAVVGNHMAPYRLIVSQRSDVEGETGLSMSYCAGCISGVSDLGEPCVTSTTTGGGGGQAPICDPRFCGNGQEDPGEDCDDENNAFGDGCDALCRLECTNDGDCPSGECAGGICTSLCGNGVVEPPICVSEGGGFDCPPANPGEMRTVYLPGDVFATVHANGDLNKDGKPDIVVLYSMGDGTEVSQGYNGTLQAYINKGNGEFEPKRFIGNVQWNDGGGSRGLDILDVDKDGDGDVVVHDGPSGIVLWRNNNLAFTKSTIISDYAAFHLAHGDVNNDGDPELGLMGYQTGVSGYYQDSVFFGGNGASFTAPPTYVDGGTAYDNMRFADMDNDGDMDVVAVPGKGNGYVVRVHLSNGDGTFADPVVMFERTANPFVHSIVTGDVNDDGNLDVAFTENSSDMVVVLGNGQGGALSNVILSSAFKSRFVAFADPTADGKLDIVYGAGQGTEGKNLWMRPGNGDGTFGTPVRFTTVSPPASGRPPFSWNYSYYYNYDLRAADYDGDGRLDLSMVHALSSDGASVILFRASVASCTAIPPVVTCSQPEECDDGPLNGAPGKCTMRCTYCGNGQIDTVNGVTEQCDEGVENGEPGSSCSLRCLSSETRDPVHTVCSDLQCVLKIGPGTNECTTDAHCERTQHLTCVGVGACAIVDGPGMDLCATDTAAADCCDPADPTCGHEQCDFLGETCDVAPGPGSPQCSANNQCAAFHFSCEGNMCAIQPGDGPNTCESSLDCTIIEPCNNDGQCSENESCQCLDCFDAVRCDACDADTKCEAGESCACGDCKTDPLCKTHTECRGVQCVSVAGAGTNECSDPVHCLRTQHLACTGVGACTIVQGPGQDTCTTATAAEDCCDPADPTCEHRQCNFLYQSCEIEKGPAMDLCDGGDCDEWKLGCVGAQCTLVPDASTAPSCATNVQCADLCNNDNVCSIDESCQCLDCFAAVRCNACDGDTLCEAGESCGCDACKNEPLCQTHTECSGVQCVPVPGAGTNECSSPADCDSSVTQHLACTGVGACTIVQGPGQDTCTTATAAEDCCDPADPTCEHRQCNFLFQSCGVAPGPAMDLCDGDADCAEWRQGCVGTQCALVPTSSGAPSCATDAQCVTPCNNDNVCAATESCQCLDCYDSIRCTGCDGDNKCEADESCACGDCADTNACIPHMACDVEARQCRIVIGAATNGCLVPEDCETEQHLACTGVGACTIVQGPGRDLCSTATAAEDCCDPADPTCNHRQCNPFTQSCITIDGPGGDDCTVTGDCEPYHSACLGEACVPVPGEGPIGCLDDSMCIGNLCLNGTPDPGEECDDGNTDNDDACNNECKRTCTDDSFCSCDEAAGVCVDLCGNGTKDFGEDCDEGVNNRTTAPANLAEWYCKALSCTRSTCFNGADDDGDQLNDAQDAGCWQYTIKRANGSMFSFVGSLLGQVTPLEPITPEIFLAGKDGEDCPADTIDRGSFCALTCDAGNICPGGESCPADGVCPVLCPNGAIDDEEQCDDGNLVDSDACNNTCRLKPCTGPDCPICGDGVHQPDIGEQCDDGNAVNEDACTNNCRIRCDGDEDCVGTCDLSTQQCLPPLCGDGEVNQQWERCDDGDIDNEDACNNQCQPTCKGDADCESGRCNQAQQVCFPTCGNGVYDVGEQCDDGNKIDGDLCNNQCQRHCTDDATCDCDEEKQLCRPLCGNGRVDIGEGCDDGNTEDRDSCNNRCQLRCRPGTVCPDSQACPQDGLCPIPGVCGDGAVNGPSEQCDDGNAVDTDNCTNACRVRCSQNLECPSGLLCIGQECSECTNSLQCQNGFCVEGRCRQALPICGNGLLEPGEVCDDANGDDTDGCTSSCLFPRDHACVASAQCQTRLCRDSVCESCASAGECSSGMRCAEGNCLFGSLQCGDGVVQAGEACDDANFNDQDQCTTACLLPLGQACTHATQCSSTICSGGACTPCRADAECSGGMRCAIGLCLTDAQMAMIPNVCGNGFLEQGEQCDDGNGKFGDGCTPSCTVGNGPIRSEVAANVSVQLPFSGTDGGAGQRPGEVDGSLHGGAGDGLADTGPATVAVMAAGAAAGTAWVRRRLMRKKH